jgi:uncharacterized membrane protein YfcA
VTVALAIAGGVLIGVSLGALGAGGSILAVPLLVYALGQSPAQATTGSLVVVGVTSLLGAAAAHRAGHVAVGRGVLFGLVATGGAVAGARAAGRVPGSVLLASFALLMLVAISITSAVALAARAGAVAQPDWGVVLLLTAAAAIGGVLGARVGARTDTRTLAAAFSGLVLVVAVATAARALPELVCARDSTYEGEL